MLSLVARVSLFSHFIILKPDVELTLIISLIRRPTRIIIITINNIGLAIANLNTNYIGLLCLYVSAVRG